MCKSFCVGVYGCDCVCMCVCVCVCVCVYVCVWMGVAELSRDSLRPTRTIGR